MKTCRLSLIAILLLSGCAVGTKNQYDPYVAAVDNQLQSRSIQTRKIADTDYTRLMSAVIGTLQDYHFRIIDIDPALGTITAYQMTRYRHSQGVGGKTELTVLVRERGEDQYSVRMNMSNGLETASESELYQQFFAALDKKLQNQREV